MSAADLLDEELVDAGVRVLLERRDVLVDVRSARQPASLTISSVTSSEACWKCRGRQDLSQLAGQGRSARCGGPS